jgi:hypothetical protein
MQQKHQGPVSLRAVFSLTDRSTRGKSHPKFSRSVTNGSFLGTFFMCARASPRFGVLRCRAANLHLPISATQPAGPTCTLKQHTHLLNSPSFPPNRHFRQCLERTNCKKRHFHDHDRSRVRVPPTWGRERGNQCTQYLSPALHVTYSFTLLASCECGVKDGCTCCCSPENPEAILKPQY